MGGKLNRTTVDNREVAYKRAGSGPPLFLLHGFICDSRVWAPQIADLSFDFDVIAWDALGCGQSDDPPEDFTMAQFAESLGGLLDAIGVDDAHLLGLSWGGTCIMEFYRLYPQRVRSAVLAGTYAGWTGTVGAEAAAQRLDRSIADSQQPGVDWIPGWVPEAFSGAASQELLDEYAAIMSDFHPVGFRAMSRAVTPDFTQILPTLDVPTLLIWGEHDSRSPLSAGEKMKELIPNSRLTVIAGAGHVSNFEQPAAFNTTVRSFLQEIT